MPSGANGWNRTVGGKTPRWLVTVGYYLLVVALVVLFVLMIPGMIPGGNGRLTHGGVFPTAGNASYEHYGPGGICRISYADFREFAFHALR